MSQINKQEVLIHSMKAMKKRRFSPLYSLRNQSVLLLMILPSLLCVIIFNYLPMYGVTFALREVDFTQVWQSPWADPLFKYFTFLTDNEFWNVFRNTVTIALGKFIVGFPAPIILALLINEIRVVWFKRTVQSISYVPHFISWVIISGMMGALLSTEVGPVAIFADAFGLEMPSLLGSEKSFVPLMVGLSVWQGVGWGTIIYLAAITGIDPTQYEAASVDGANKLQKIWHVTLPGMVPTISILLVLAIPGIINAGFDQIYNFQNPMVMGVADILDTYILRIGLDQGNYSLATAVGLFNSVLGLGLILLTNYVSKRQGGQGIW